jgi:prevent-host-death family protein
MKLAGKVKPLSHFKAHAPDVIRGMAKDREPVVLTVRGEARAVLQDIDSFEEMQETLALLKILALSQKDLEAGRVRPMDEVFRRLRRQAKR